LRRGHNTKTEKKHLPKGYIECDYLLLKKFIEKQSKSNLKQR